MPDSPYSSGPLKKAYDQFLSGSYQDALDSLSSLPEGERKKLASDPDAKRLLARLRVQLNRDGEDYNQLLGLPKPKAEDGASGASLLTTPSDASSTVLTRLPDTERDRDQISANERYADVLYSDGKKRKARVSF